MNTNTTTIVTLMSVALCGSAWAGNDLEALGPLAESGSYAGQAMDVSGNLLAIGQKVSSNYVVMLYEHSTEGWEQSQAVNIGTRRAVSLAFGDGFVGAALSGSGSVSGVVLEPTGDSWGVAANLQNPDTSRFNNFDLAAASDNAVFITCNDNTQQYRDAVLVYERGAVGWQHVQTIAPSSATCTLFAEDIDAAGDMLVIGATGVFGCSGGNLRGAHVYMRGESSWDHTTTLQDGDSNGKWVACDGTNVVSWCSSTGPNSTIDYLYVWKQNGSSFTSDGLISSGSNWGYDIYFPAGMEIDEGVIAFGTCDGFWGCQTNSTINRTVYTVQKSGNFWNNWSPLPATIPSGYGSAGFGRNVAMGGGSILIGAPAYSGSRGVVFGAPMGDVLRCPADFDGNGNVDGADLGVFMSEWGGSGRADLNGDSVVNAADLGMLLSMWGDC